MRIDQLGGLIALMKVAEKKSFTIAAAELRVSPSALSQAVKQLESRLGVALLSRTTRSTGLTEAGEKFLQEFGPPLKAVLVAMERIGTYSDRPMGLLRINLPRAAYIAVVHPILQSFKKAYPGITVELYFDDTMTDIVEGGFDAGIRSEELLAKDMTAVRVSHSYNFVVAGSPAYFKSSGRPQTPQDLLSHDCIRYRFESGQYYERWEFEKGKKEFSVEVKGTTIVNDPTSLIQMAVSGLGLIYNTENDLEALIKAGKLETVLDTYWQKSEGYFLYYPNRSQVLPKLRVFIDFLKTSLKK